MIAILFIILAAFFKACADTMAHHYSDSVFSLWNYKFWDASRSWRFAKKVFKYPVDGWHIANSLMIVSFCAAATWTHSWTWCPAIVQFLIYGVAFNIVFNVFYNKILR